MTPTFAEASSRCDLIVGHGETSGVVARASFESSRLDHFSPWTNGRMTGSSRQVDVYASLGSRPFYVSRHLSPCYAYRTTRRITVLSEEALTAILEIANRLSSPEVFEGVPGNRPHHCRRFVAPCPRASATLRRMFEIGSSMPDGVRIV